MEAAYNRPSMSSTPIRGPERIRRALTGGYPLIYVHSWEESRVERSLVAMSQRYFEKPVAYGSWSCVDGLTVGQERWPDTADPVKALDTILAYEGSGFFLMKDLPAHFAGRLDLVRRLRDAYRQLKGKGKYVVLVSPQLLLPEDIKKEIYVVDYDLPDDAEINYLLTHLAKRFFADGLSEVDLRRLALGVKGLTQDEIEHVVTKVFTRSKQFDDAAFMDILAEKEQASRKEGVLEFVPPRFTVDDIGGLENLKEWLVKRRTLFTREAQEAGMPVPKGLLMMGMSGCGKSLSVKAISALWNLPLFRLDMNLVFGTDNPEWSFHRALKAVEGMSPALLWIDEIEMAITGGREGGSGEGALGRIFSAFLTWMQEKDAMVFVAATANRIHLLPAEVIRKGRFDQVFFLDLPNEVERKAIFGVHLKKRGADLNKFDVVFLSKATMSYNGAEIESVVQAAAIDAFNENRVLDENDLSRIISATVPLAKTMEEQIKAIKSWAHNRAVSASKN